MESYEISKKNVGDSLMINKLKILITITVVLLIFIGVYLWTTPYMIDKYESRFDSEVESVVSLIAQWSSLNTQQDPGWLADSSVDYLALAQYIVENITTANTKIISEYPVLAFGNKNGIFAFPPISEGKRLTVIGESTSSFYLFTILATISFADITVPNAVPIVSKNRVNMGFSKNK
jgi:hypothetical protein